MYVKVTRGCIEMTAHFRVSVDENESCVSEIFSESTDILVHKIKWGDAEKKYPDKYLIATNTYVEDGDLYGDIIGILTPEEYCALKRPKPMAPKYYLWEGLELKAKGLGVLGYYV